MDSTTITYAEDIQLYLSFKPTPAEQAVSIAKIGVSVSEIDSQIVSNRVKLNRGETELLVLSARHHITPVLTQLHWLPVNQRINDEILLLTYKALNGQTPSYIIELLEPYYSPTRNLRSSSKNLLKTPPVKLVSCGHKCFSPAAPSSWKSPLHYQSA